MRRIKDLEFSDTELFLIQEAIKRYVATKCDDPFLDFQVTIDAVNLYQRLDYLLKHDEKGNLIDA